MNQLMYHMWPNRDGSWSVRRRGAARASRIFSSRGAALSYARGLAKRGPAELFIHRIDGLVQRSETYGTAALQ